MTAPRILILSASVGAGHVRAAQALELAFRRHLPHAHVENHDVLTHTNAAFRRLYGKAYLDLVNRAPHVLGYFYDLLDRPGKPTRRRSDKLRLLVEKWNLKKFRKFLRDGDWSVAVHTHFLPAEILAAMRRDGQLDLPQVTVTTDFDTHRLWVNEPCERYCTATDEGALYLQSWGVPTTATRVTGIPIHPAFEQSADRTVCRQRHGLALDRAVVLQLAGGFGVGPVRVITRQLLSLTEPVQLVVVCGRNDKLREQLTAEPVPERHRLIVLGFTQQIDELMAAADLVVSKPGGLTTSETLARGVGMVIVNPIPGQESRNSDFLLENGAAVKVNNLTTLAHKVGGVLANPDRLALLRHNALRLAKPHAATAIVEEVVQLL